MATANELDRIVDQILDRVAAMSRAGLACEVRKILERKGVLVDQTGRDGPLSRAG
jgi:hypothetical protein